ncbi:unnamed protein product, partial [Bubo scandiacus]
MEMATSPSYATNFPPIPTQFERRLFFETSIECSLETIPKDPQASRRAQSFSLLLAVMTGTTAVVLHMLFPSWHLIRDLHHLQHPQASPCCPLQSQWGC